MIQNCKRYACATRSSLPADRFHTETCENEKRHFNIKFLLQTSSSYFTERCIEILYLKMQEPLIFCPLYCKIMHLKAKREFTLLVASYSDFVSANVILNQHP